MVSGSHTRRILSLALAVVALTVPSVVAPVIARAHTSPTPVSASIRSLMSPFDVPPAAARAALGLEVVASEENGRVTLRFTLPRAGIVRITLSTLDGKEMGTLASGLSNAGENRLEIDVRSIPPGQYRCTLQTRDGNASARLVIVR